MPRQWELTLLAAAGHVVLLHDGGADRAATISPLPRLIAEARAEGYTFTTVTSLVPSQYAYNEEKVIAKTLAALARTARPAGRAAGPWRGLLRS